MFPFAEVGQFISEIYIRHIDERCESQLERRICKGEVEITHVPNIHMRGHFGKGFRLGFLLSKIYFCGSL